ALCAPEAVADSAAPDWGRDDAFVWAGRCAMKLKDFAGARDFFRQALVANPANGWTRTALLPAAEDSLARRTKPSRPRTRRGGPPRRGVRFARAGPSVGLGVRRRRAR